MVEGKLATKVVVLYSSEKACVCRIKISSRPVLGETAIYIELLLRTVDYAANKM